MHALLKFIVIGLGVLIALALGLLVYGLIKTSENPDWRLFGNAKTAKAPTTAAAPPPAQLAPPVSVSGDIELNLPTGCEITDVRPASAQVFILTGPVGVCGQVLIIDARTGAVSGRIKP